MTMNTTSMNRQLQLFGVMLLLLGSQGCTKEGLQGPQGPQGPPGENGTGGAGGSMRVVTYTLPATTDLQWGGGEYEGTYYYRLTETSNPDYQLTITLPDSLTEYIETGTMFIYMGGDGVWQQWPYSPVEFYGIKNFGYILYKGYEGYHIYFFALGQLRASELEIFRREIRFVFIPRTAEGVLEP